MSRRFQSFIIQTLQEAGAAALSYYQKVGVKYHKKFQGDVVTEADLASNTIIRNAIKRAFPEHSILSEETGVEGMHSSEYMWIVDPLDGTRSFAHQTPLWGVMVGLARNGEMVAAGIYDPIHGEMVCGEAGSGVQWNGKPVRISAENDFWSSYGMVSMGCLPWMHRLRATLYRSFEGSRVFVCELGSAALSGLYMATGRRDWRAAWNFAVWDAAIPAFLAREAGCVVTNVLGEPWSLRDRTYLAAPQALHSDLLAIFTEVAQEVKDSIYFEEAEIKALMPSVEKDERMPG